MATTKIKYVVNFDEPEYLDSTCDDCGDQAIYQESFDGNLCLDHYDLGLESMAADMAYDSFGDR
jgi:hypothetical protein